MSAGTFRPINRTNQCNFFVSDQNRRIHITLVDHNENELFERIGNLTEIIDHHKDIATNRSPDVRTEIDTAVGSCCTLIARRFIDYCEENGLKIDEQVALLLYGPIVLGEFRLRQLFRLRKFEHTNVLAC